MKENIILNGECYNMTKYYDGHHIESDLSVEESDKAVEEALKENENLTEWPHE